MADRLYEEADDISTGVAVSEREKECGESYNACRHMFFQKKEAGKKSLEVPVEEKSISNLRKRRVCLPLEAEEEVKENEVDSKKDEESVSNVRKQRRFSETSYITISKEKGEGEEKKAEDRKNVLLSSESADLVEKVGYAFVQELIRSREIVGTWQSENEEEEVKKKKNKRSKGTKITDTIAPKAKEEEHRVLSLLSSISYLREEDVMWLELYDKVRPPGFQRSWYEQEGKHQEPRDERKSSRTFLDGGKTFGSFECLTPLEIEVILERKKQQITDKVLSNLEELCQRQKLSQKDLKRIDAQRKRMIKMQQSKVNLSHLQSFQSFLKSHNQDHSFLQLDLERLKDIFKELQAVQRNSNFQQNNIINKINTNCNNNNNNNNNHTTVNTNININLAASASDTVSEASFSGSCHRFYSFSPDEKASLKRITLADNDEDIRQLILEIMSSHANYCMKALFCSLYVKDKSLQKELPAILDRKITTVHKIYKEMFDMLHVCK